MKCDPTSAGRTLFSAGMALGCVCAGEQSTVRLSQVRPHKGRLLIRLAEVDDIDAAQRYAGATLYAPRDQIELGDGEYLDADLIGCELVGIGGLRYGTVDGVEHYPASDMLLVAGRMVPMIGAFVRDIDIVGRQITIDPPAGLLD